MSKHTVPCEICGAATTSRSTKRCNGCWEVEAGLRDYLKHPAGQAHALSLMPLLDDWVDGDPDAWDYEAILTENQVTVKQSNVIDDREGTTPHTDSCAGWSLTWQHGLMYIGDTTEVIARKAAALFVSLWLRGVSASFADKLMDGFIVYLERQAGITKGFVATAHITPSERHLILRFNNNVSLDLGLKEGDQVGVTLYKL